ncbi:MAG: YdcF family protein, partial [Microcystaceae cyanobacterium]
SAKAVKEWLLTSSPPIQAINLYSSDVHSRRSWLIYQRILSPQFSVGILSFPSPYYDPHRWWLYSEGVRSVLSEAIAYFYAVLIWPFTQY